MCDNTSLEFLQGAIIEFEDSLMRSAFQVCGCGVDHMQCFQTMAYNRPAMRRASGQWTVCSEGVMPTGPSCIALKAQQACAQPTQHNWSLNSCIPCRIICYMLLHVPPAPAMLCISNCWTTQPV